MKFVALVTAALATLSLATPKAHSSTSLEPRQNNPDDLLIFNCQDIPEVCTNMCYGAYCLDISESLTYDRPSASEKRRRRRAAGCIQSGGNRCSVRKGHEPGFQCDEYPFASTVSNGGSDVRVNRCVPAAQNSRQGATINAFYQAAYCGGGPCDFTVSFGNPGAAGVSYCSAWATPEDCDVDDDNEVIGPGGNTDPSDDETADDGTDTTDPGEEEPTTEDKKKKRRSNKIVGRYRTASGFVIEVPGGAYIGQRAFYVEPVNATLWEVQAAERDLNPWLGLDDMVANLVVKEDTVVEQL
ncbi:hypothetical protein MFIFM68171_01096 [Madurella fahalii]|uniref:Deoxyribonuclease NucA/NucB domain-containing protein n=1 Tax=Madurella fahalii TaxID=1157608 RepID=A0ABQ0FZF7_9PEZI